MLSSKNSWKMICATIVLMTAGSNGVILAADVKAPTVSGFVDTTYMYNFNTPNTHTTELRSFDQKDNNFAINAAQVKVDGTAGDAGYTVKLLAGNDARVISPVDSDSTPNSNRSIFSVEEAFLTYTCPVTKIGVKAGKFVTLEGIEVIESKDNPTISRGTLFGLAEPFTHTGLLLTRSVGKVDLGLGVVNGWDLTSDNNAGKTVFGKIGLNFGDPFTLNISGYVGPEQPTDPTGLNNVEGNTRSSLDVTGVTKVNPKLTLNYQWNIGQEKNALVHPFAAPGTVRDTLDSWQGVGIQPVLTITDKFSIGARAEYFFNNNGTRLVPLPAAAPTIEVAETNFTIAPSFKCTDNTMFRLEYRYDRSNKKIFQKDANPSADPNLLKDSMSTASAEWIVTF
jgi:hypothetical protein